MTGPLDDPGDFMTDDVVEIPVPNASVGAIVVALGGRSSDDGHMWTLPAPTEPLPVLPLMLGDVDLGKWRVEGMDMRRSRWPGPMYTVRLRREMER